MQFVNDKEKSVVLFHHWGGEEFATKRAKDFLKTLPQGRFGIPVDRREPQTIMRTFVAWLAQNYPENYGKDTYSMYFGFDENDGDNSDNGHWVVDLVTNKIERVD